MKALQQARPFVTETEPSNWPHLTLMPLLPLPCAASEVVLAAPGLQVAQLPRIKHPRLDNGGLATSAPHLNCCAFISMTGS